MLKLESLFSWVEFIFGSKPSPAFVRKSWEECAGRDVSALAPAPVRELVPLETHRREKRAAVGEPLKVLVAYAQDDLIYSPEGKMISAREAGKDYAAIHFDQKVNKFRQAYKQEAPLLLHQKLADIVVDAAIDLKRNQGWTLAVFDGLRTMDAGYVMYHNARDEWLKDKLLSPPGSSAHNRALAVDSMAFDAKGNEVPMGGHFDHSNMTTNHRNYPGIFTGNREKDAQIRENRLIRERAFLRAAIKNGTVIAPLREEFWDDRMPGSEKDLWRVVESLARCTGQEAPAQKAEDYETFRTQWVALNRDGKLTQAFGQNASFPPPPEAIIYHEKLQPIFDRDLPPEWKQSVMDPAKLPSPSLAARTQ